MSKLYNLKLFHSSNKFIKSFNLQQKVIQFLFLVIVDSANIIDVLSEQRDSTEAHLKPEQQGLVRAFDVLIENSLTYCTAKYRYEHFDEFVSIWPLSFLSFPLLKTLFKWYIVRMVMLCLKNLLIY